MCSPRKPEIRSCWSGPWSFRLARNKNIRQNLQLHKAVSLLCTNQLPRNKGEAGGTHPLPVSHTTWTGVCLITILNTWVCMDLDRGDNGEYRWTNFPEAKNTCAKNTCMCMCVCVYSWGFVRVCFFALCMLFGDHLWIHLSWAFLSLGSVIHENSVLSNTFRKSTMGPLAFCRLSSTKSWDTTGFPTGELKNDSGGH